MNTVTVTREVVKPRNTMPKRRKGALSTQDLMEKYCKTADDWTADFGGAVCVHYVPRR